MVVVVGAAIVERDIRGVAIVVVEGGDIRVAVLGLKMPLFSSTRVVWKIFSRQLLRFQLSWYKFSPSIKNKIVYSSFQFKIFQKNQV